jgi:hypothetical protein
MSVEQIMVIDFISEKDDKVILTISDHLEWDEDNEHITLLQDKINAYLMAIESGQVNTKFPSSVGKQYVISIALMHAPNKNGEMFLLHVKEVLAQSGYGFSYYVFK